MKALAKGFKAMYASFSKVYKGSTPYLCRVDGIDINPKTGKLEIIVHIGGKPVFLRYSPQELITQDSLLEKFPPLHVKMITTLACLDAKNSNYEIVAYDYSEDKEFLIIRDAATDRLFRTTAAEIAKDKAILKRFSAEDAYRITYSYVEKILQKEKQDLFVARKSTLRVVNGNFR